MVSFVIFLIYVRKVVKLKVSHLPHDPWIFDRPYHLLKGFLRRLSLPGSLYMSALLSFSYTLYPDYQNLLIWGLFDHRRYWTSHAAIILMDRPPFHLVVPISIRLLVPLSVAGSVAVHWFDSSCEPLYGSTSFEPLYGSNLLRCWLYRIGVPTSAISTFDISASKRFPHPLASPLLPHTHRPRVRCVILWIFLLTGRSLGARLHRVTLHYHTEFPQTPSVIWTCLVFPRIRSTDLIRVYKCLLFIHYSLFLFLTINNE